MVHSPEKPQQQKKVIFISLKSDGGKKKQWQTRKLQKVKM